MCYHYGHAWNIFLSSIVLLSPMRNTSHVLASDKWHSYFVAHLRESFMQHTGKCVSYPALQQYCKLEHAAAKEAILDYW